MMTPDEAWLANAQGGPQAGRSADGMFRRCESTHETNFGPNRPPVWGTLIGTYLGALVARGD